MKSIKTILKECLECKREFLASPAEINRGNGKFCSLSCSVSHTNRTNQNIRSIICKNCGKDTLTIRSNTIFCSIKCKNKFNSHKIKISNKKTLSILPCEICGWNKATVDIHHIVPVKNEGSNELSNLICLCPNCHRMVHSHLISQEQLFEVVNKRTISSSTINVESDANSGN